MHVCILQVCTHCSQPSPVRLQCMFVCSVCEVVPTYCSVMYVCSSLQGCTVQSGSVGLYVRSRMMLSYVHGLYVCLSVCLSVCLFVCLSVCLSDHPAAVQWSARTMQHTLHSTWQQPLVTTTACSSYWRSDRTSPQVNAASWVNCTLQCWGSLCYSMEGVCVTVTVWREPVLQHGERHMAL